jgi:hypothetical protein
MDSDWKSIFGMQGNLLLSHVTGELGVASTRLRRFRLPSLDFDIEQESVGVAATKQIFEAAANVTVYQSVFAFLLEGTKFAWNWAEDQTDPQQAQFVHDMYNVPLPHEDPEGLKAPVLSLHEASAFNRFLEKHEAINLKCQSQDLDYYQLTNDMHEQMRLCKKNLEQPIGWELRSAFLASKCDSASPGGRVRSWLTDIEQEWAWDHTLSSALPTPLSFPLDTAAEELSPAWTCPLYWLQQYHDDNTKFQARSPSWQRNAVRFEHVRHHRAPPATRAMAQGRVRA